jgi:hypothetical protein
MVRSAAKVFSILLIVPVVGCKSAESDGIRSSATTYTLPTTKPSISLGAEWMPLKFVTEWPRGILPSREMMPIGEHLYVRDLDRWMEHHQPRTGIYRAVLAHQREHARRQCVKGVLSWIADYSTKPEFMWSEEQVGWYHQIRVLRIWGKTIRPEMIAAELVEHRNLVGPMTTYEKALKWAELAITGRWLPPE